MAVPFSSGKAKVVTTPVNPSSLHYSQALNTHPRKSITLRYLDEVASGAVLVSTCPRHLHLASLALSIQFYSAIV